jgi:TolA-binding protein
VKINTEKILGFAIIILLLFNFFFIIHINGTTNDSIQKLEQKITALNKEINALQNKSVEVEQNSENAIEFLRQEYTNYRRFANSERQSFINLVSIFFVALGVLVTGGTIVLYWIFGQTKKEVKENAEATVKTSVNNIRNDAVNSLKNIVGTEMKNFEDKYDELKRFMDNQYSLRQSKVLVISPENKKEEMENLELKRIREIVKEAQVISINEFEEYERRLENQNLDIIVYRYEKIDKAKQEVRIRDFIQTLKDRDLKIPVVVYATRGNLVDGEDGEIVNSYPFSVMANLPTTLTSNMISLANVLSYVRR